MSRTFAALAALLVLSACNKPRPPAAPDPIKPARTAVRDLLLDPASAQFRRESIHPEAVCGEVNAKNRMGGYVGFEGYIVLRQSKFARVSAPPDFELLTGTMGRNIMDKSVHDAIDQLGDQCAFAADAVSICGWSGPWKSGDSMCQKFQIADMRKKTDAIPVR